MDVRKSISGIALISILSACGGNPTRVEYVDRPVEVFIPVPAEIPEPAIIKEPFLPIWLLTEENKNDPDLIAKYYVKTVKLLQTHSNLLQCQIDAYRTESEPQCKEE
jgi:hypothetical protein